jgi:hypothetical protein
MSYFIYRKSTGLFVLETTLHTVLMCYPASDFDVICSIHGY